jgi:ABC-2 type transport system permease protein
MNWRTVRALLKKDVALFMANRFYLLMTVVGLVFYVAAYFVLPRAVDESLSLAVYAPVMPPAFQQLTGQPGTDIKLFDSEGAVKQAVLKDNYQAGIALPADILTVWANGGTPKITVYYQAGSPPEVAEAVTALVKELSYAQTGQALTAEVTEQTLGPDMLGMQVALRDRMRPLLAVFILLLEIMSLASLITVEIAEGTARALLVTPMRATELYTGKAILGVGLALVQALLFMGIVGGLDHQPMIILLTFLIGSVLVVGTGFLVAALAKDVTAVTGWGILVFVILAIPGFGSLIPGLLSSWAKVIPSYYLTDTVTRVTNYGAAWGDVAGNLAILTFISAALVLLGLITLRRRYL